MSPRDRSAAKSVTADVLIPEKLYFRIGEVSRLCHLPAYVLRFWETEFPQLKPVKSSTGQRMYRRRDVESVLQGRPTRMGGHHSDLQLLRHPQDRGPAGMVADPLHHSRRQHRDRNHGLDGRCRSAAETKLVGNSGYRAIGEHGRARIFGLVRVSAV